MVKALKEGVSDPDSFANKLTDKRYAEFVTSYNFAKYGELATSYNRAQNDVPKNFATRVELASTQNGFDYFGEETGYYLTNIPKVTSVDDLMADNRLLTYAMAAFGLDSTTEAAGTRARDAGRRRERSRQSCKHAERQALRELRLGVQLRGARRAGHVARRRPEGGSQTVCRRNRAGSCQAERRLRQGRGRLLQGQHLEGEVDHRPAWPTRACCPSPWPPTGWTPQPRRRSASARCLPAVSATPTARPTS